MYLVFNDQAVGGRWAGMDTWTTVCSGDREGSEDILNSDPNVLPDDDAGNILYIRNDRITKWVCSTSLMWYSPEASIPSRSCPDLAPCMPDCAVQCKPSFGFLVLRESNEITRNI